MFRTAIVLTSLMLVGLPLGNVSKATASDVGCQNKYPALSPDGQWIVFQSNCEDSLSWDIFTRRVADPGAIRRLTHSSGDNLTPVISPDGSQIAFQSSRDGNLEIYVMNIDGSGQRNLTNSIDDESHPKWSADGRKIIFDRSRSTDSGSAYADLYEMNADGTGLRRLTSYHERDTYPSYSPDELRVLWRRIVVDSVNGESRLNSEIFVMNRDGSNQVNLTNHAAYDGYPAWSPDGTAIVFASNRDTDNRRNFHLYVMNSDGTNLRRLLENDGNVEDARPMWSWDGRYIIFNRRYIENSPGGMAVGAMTIHVLDLDTVPTCDPLPPGDPLGARHFEAIFHNAISAELAKSRGVAWGDFDGDGYDDIAVANSDYTPPSIYRNLGNSTFRRLELPDTIFSGVWSEGVTWIDVDNDRDLDLFVATSWGGRNLVLQNKANGEFVRMDAGSLTADTSSAQASCWCDYDRDGDLDAFVVMRDNNDDELHVNDGNGRFHKSESGPWVGRQNDARACSWIDADDDGRADLFVGNFVTRSEGDIRKAPNLVYWNSGDGSFEFDSLSPIASNAGATYGLSWSDYDNDGDPDLYVTNIASSDYNFLYRNVGYRQFQKASVSEATTLSQGPSKGQTWGDFDNDGDEDLFVASGTENYADVRNLYFRNDGNGILTRMYAGALVSHENISAGAASSDFDSDGDLDIMVANWGGLGEQNILYENRSENMRGNWLAVRLRGVESNSHGIGARVRIITPDGKSQSRWVNASTGYGSQNSYAVHFGIGANDVVDSLVIYWPSTLVNRHINMEPNKYYTVTEGAGVDS